MTMAVIQVPRIEFKTIEDFIEFIDKVYGDDLDLQME